MSPRTTGILAVVAALLGAFIYFYEIGGETSRKAEAQAEQRLFPDLDAGQIGTLAFRTQDGVDARFGRVDGAWTVLEPSQGPADATALDAIASALANLSREGEISDASDLDQYGLGEDARIVRFETEDEMEHEAENRARGLVIGRATPVGGNVYVMPLGSERIGYVPKFRLNALSRNFDDLRDRRIFPFESGEVTALSLRWPGTEIALGKRDGDWRMLAPVQEPADSTTVRDLLTDLAYLSARGFVDEESPVALEAMDEVALEIELTIADETRRVTIGGRLGDDRVVRGPAGRLFTIAAERLDDFERTISAYRSRTLSEFEVSAARRLSLEFQEPDRETRVVEARLEGAGWTGTDPAIDPDRASDLVRALARLRATTIVADAMGPAELAELGLDPPRVRVRVAASGDDSGDLAEVALGRLDEERGLHAQRAGDPKVYLLDPEAARDLPISWEAFEEHFTGQGAEEEAALDLEADLETDHEAEPLEPR